MVNLVYNPRRVNLAVSRGNGVIKANDIATLNEAHCIVRAAEEKASQIIDAAQAKYKHEEERGYIEGRERADKDAFTRLLAEQVYLEKSLCDMEIGLGEVVKNSVRKIIASFDDARLTELTIVSALQKMREQNHLQIHLPPSLRKEFEPLTSKLRATFPQIGSIDIVEDASLEPPNFVMESNTSRIDCNLGHKLEELEALVDEAVAGLARPSQRLTANRMSEE